MADDGPEIEREDLLRVVESQSRQIAHLTVRLEAALRVLRSYRLGEEEVGGRLIGVADRMADPDDDESTDEDFEGEATG